MTETTRIKVDNEGTVIVIKSDSKKFFIDEHDVWDTYYRGMMALTNKFEDIQDIVVSEKTVIVKFSLQEEEGSVSSDTSLYSLVTFNYSPTGVISKIKRVNHEIYDGDENAVTFERIFPTQNPNFFIF